MAAEWLEKLISEATDPDTLRVLGELKERLAKVAEAFPEPRPVVQAPRHSQEARNYWRQLGESE